MAWNLLSWQNLTIQVFKTHMRKTLHFIRTFFLYEGKYYQIEYNIFSDFQILESS